MSGWRATYNDGTISVGDGDTTIVGAGTYWSPYANQANLLIAGSRVAFVSAVADATHLTIDPPWSGGDLADADYVLVQFPLASLVATKELRDHLAKLATLGITYAVADNQDAPDDAIGEDGDRALKTNTLPWILWTKVDGHWERQAQWVPFQPRGTWSGATSYSIGDFVNRGAYVFMSNTNSNLNHAPDDTTPASTTHWTWVPMPGVSDVLDQLGIHAITISTSFPSGGQDGDLWFKVA